MRTGGVGTEESEDSLPRRDGGYGGGDGEVGGCVKEGVK